MSAPLTGVHDPRSFAHLVGAYERFAVLTGAELRAWLVFHVPLRRSGRALDVGCGTGVHTGLLADRYSEVLAVDVSAPMLAYARRYRPHECVAYQQRGLGEVNATEDGRFDLLLCAYVLHALPDAGAALAHLRSLVRPGGTVLVADWVDARRVVPRAWLRAEAWRTFRRDLLNRRPLPEAVELLRLQLDPDWLDHQTAARLIEPDRWRELASAAFPGAQLGSLYRTGTLAWRAPTS